jgi:hypothetical protein
VKKNHLDKLIKLTGDLEDVCLNNESMSRSEIDLKISSIYVKMTETVGAIMLDMDEPSGALE